MDSKRSNDAAYKRERSMKLHGQLCLMPLAHYYDVDREHSTKYTSSHSLLKNREAAEWYRNEQVASKKNNLHEHTRAL